MTRGRISDQGETAREGSEGALASLGNARVYAILVRDRVKAAIVMRNTDVLSLAVADLEKLETLIQQAQAWIKSREDKP